MYSIEFTDRARRQLLKLHPQAQDRIENAIDRLQQWPARSGSVRGLRGPMAGLYRVRAGDYRAIFAVDEDREVISVRAVGHRGDIYT